VLQQPLTALLLGRVPTTILGLLLAAVLRLWGLKVIDTTI